MGSIIDLTRSSSRSKSKSSVIDLTSPKSSKSKSKSPLQKKSKSPLQKKIKSPLQKKIKSKSKSPLPKKSKSKSKSKSPLPKKSKSKSKSPSPKKSKSKSKSKSPSPKKPKLFNIFQKKSSRSPSPKPKKDAPPLPLSPLRRVPMLAEAFAKQAKNIRYPAFAQPKLDGCRAIYANGSLSSRTGLPISEAKRILAELSAANDAEGLVLDGELYVHGMSFQNVMKLVHADSPLLEYHVYDIIPSKSKQMTFTERNKRLREFFKDHSSVLRRVKFVETLKVSSAKEVEDKRVRFEKEGFEGAMVRNAESTYIHGRSKDLQKVKSFKDAEFEVVGAEASKTGGVIWRCSTDGGKVFAVKPKGSDADAVEAFKHYKTMIGRYYTVQYQELTDAGIPRFPVGLGFKDLKDLDLNRKAKSRSKSKSPKRPSPKIDKRSKSRSRSPPNAKPKPKPYAGPKEAKPKKVDAYHSGRPAPSEHAKDHKGERKVGNDGKMYESRADKRGVYTWKKV